MSSDNDDDEPEQDNAPVESSAVAAAVPGSVDETPAGKIKFVPKEFKALYR